MRKTIITVALAAADLALDEPGEREPVNDGGA